MVSRSSLSTAPCGVSREDDTGRSHSTKKGAFHEIFNLQESERPLAGEGCHYIMNKNNTRDCIDVLCNSYICYDNDITSCPCFCPVFSQSARMAGGAALSTEIGRCPQTTSGTECSMWQRSKSVLYVGHLLHLTWLCWVRKMLLCENEQVTRFGHWTHKDMRGFQMPPLIWIFPSGRSVWESSWVRFLFCLSASLSLTLSAGCFIFSHSYLCFESSSSRSSSSKKNKVIKLIDITDIQKVTRKSHHVHILLILDISMCLFLDV